MRSRTRHAGWDNERFGSATFAGFMELKQSGNIGKDKHDRQSRTSAPHQRLSEKAITQDARFLIFFFGACNIRYGPARWTSRFRLSCAGPTSVTRRN